MRKKYERAIVVFDGYDEMSTTAMTQQRPASGKVAACHFSKKHVYNDAEPKANARGARVWHMKKAKEQLGKEVCRNFLFLHAVTGCDTTLRIYGVGKAAALKKLENVPYYKEQANVGLHLSFCCFWRCHCR